MFRDKVKFETNNLDNLGKSILFSNWLRKNNRNVNQTIDFKKIHSYETVIFFCNDIISPILLLHLKIFVSSTYFHEHKLSREGRNILKFYANVTFPNQIEI